MLRLSYIFVLGLEIHDLRDEKLETYQRERERDLERERKREREKERASTIDGSVIVSKQVKAPLAEA